MPTFPLASIVKSDAPVEDATLNGLTAGEPCTLNVYEEEVAFTPDTVLLSRSIPVASVEVPMNLVTKPFVPPETVPDGVPQRVLVPVDCRNCPATPI